MTQFGYGQRRGGSSKIRWGIAAVIALVGIISYFNKSKVTNEETGKTYRVAINVDQEKALGLEAAQKMIPDMGGEIDPRTNSDAALVDEVGARIVATINPDHNHYGTFNFYLINDAQTINAFALPGGQVSITKGLMDRLENEAQLAGVLGHEIGHVIAQHSAQQMAKQGLFQSIAMAVGVGASDDQGRGQMAVVAAQMALNMKSLSYSREHESESDQIGLKYMAQAGYDPNGMLRVMEILKEASKGSRQPEFLSSHPLPDTRIQAIQEYIQKAYPNGVPPTLTKGRSLEGDSRVSGSGPSGQVEQEDGKGPFD